MLMDPKKLSDAIRMKKKKMLEAEPEIVGTSPTPDMNAQDVYDMEQKARIEDTINAPAKINADDANLDMSQEEANNVGLSSDEMKRMGRLKSFFAGVKLSK